MQKIQIKIFLFFIALSSFQITNAESSVQSFFGKTEAVDYNLYTFKAESGTRKVLLISDIDDTIKVSHVLNPAVAAIRSFDSTTPFVGMAQLYQLIVNQNPQQTAVIYLSNAPEEIVGSDHFLLSHQAFIQSNHFPEGSLILRKNILDQNHKVNAIRFLIDKYKPEKVIMFGDNGEKDNITYETITQDVRYKQILFTTYIHMVYSTQALIETGKLPYKDQIGYVTAVEAGIDLKNRNLLTSQASEYMLNKISPYIMNESAIKLSVGDPIAFPYFMECDDFQPKGIRTQVSRETTWLNYVNLACQK